MKFNFSKSSSDLNHSKDSDHSLGSMKLFFLFIAISFLLGSSMIDYNEQKSAPNVIFIEVDDLTAKYLGCFGEKNAVTPNIDKLAKSGVLFEHAQCQGVMCGPSRNSIITGLYPHNMGFYLNGQLTSLPKGVPTFTKEIQKVGYHTMWVGKSHLRPNTDDYKGLEPSDKKTMAMKKEMGFDYVYQSAGRTVVLKQAKEFLLKGKEWIKGKDNYADFLFENKLLQKFVDEGKKDKPSTLDPDTEYMDGHFTSHAIEAMESYKEQKPFFLWLNYSCPHEPFDVPQKYYKSFPPSKMPNAIDFKDEKYTVPSMLRPHPDVKSKPDQAQYMAEYFATIHYIDKQVGRVVNFIQKSKFSDNTIIVFFSDHGIMAGDHGLIHKGTLYKEVLNPSLIISYPKLFKANRERTAVELIDLSKTIMDIAGVEASVTNKFNGYSLVPLLIGKGEYDGNGLAFAEIQEGFSVFDGRYKFIKTANLDILFDLKNNPNETINLANKETKKLEEMKNALATFITKTGKVLPPAKNAKITEE
jgi:arylsulfatase A-like enzyme